MKYDSHPDVIATITNTIGEWETEAVAAIEGGTGAIVDSFRVTGEAIKKSTESVKADVETDRKSKKA